MPHLRTSRVLARLDEFLRDVRKCGTAKAYDKVAKREDENGKPENPYASRAYRQTIDGLDDCPHICLRLPTGGGKTYLAACSIKYAAEYMETDYPTVLWLAPTDAICTQTAQMLKDTDHPCRRALEERFGNNVEIYDISNFNATRAQDFDSSACIIVSTAQMFAVRQTARQGNDGMTTATRRIYATQELLQPHFERFLPMVSANELKGLERDEKGDIKYSFVNLLHLRRPLVISDEAHNFLSDLSQKVLRRINPKCILEWTATPREDLNGIMLHNVLTSTSAEELHAEEMLKLPVWLTAHKDWQQSVNGAIIQRNDLAKAAKDSGDAVRPIVLYKAQRKSGDNPITPEVLREHLINVERIDKNTIAIATGEIRGIEGVDLLSPNCPIEHIITVEALREGWDCSYAYVLCSVANIKSKDSVEQLMGRVMRMPFAEKRKNEKLNLAYAHLPSDTAAETVKIMRDKMADVMGFEDGEVKQFMQESFSPEYQGGYDGGLLDEANRTFHLAEKPDFNNLPEAAQQTAKAGVEVHTNPPEKGGYKVIVKKPLAAEVQQVIVDAIPAERRPHEKRRLEYINRQLSKPESPAQRGVNFAALPQLFFDSPDEGKVPANGDNLHAAADWNDIGDNYLIENFSITETAQTYEIRLGGGKVIYSKQGTFELPPDAESAKGEKQLIGWLEKQIRHPDGRYYPETLQKLIRDNINALDYSTKQLWRAKHLFAEALKQRLEKHAKEVAQKTAKKYLFDNKEIECHFTFSFPKTGYAPAKAYRGVYDFKKHYYGHIGDFDSGQECDCAMALDANNEVKHWVRNTSKTDHSYRIPLGPGANFYPDFVAELTSGEVLVVEYKGAYLVAGNEHKTKVGELLESKAKEVGGKCFFVVITKDASSPSMEEQIKNKIRQIHESNGH